MLKTHRDVYRKLVIITIALMGHLIGIFGAQLFAQAPSTKEYIYLNGKLVAVETDPCSYQIDSFSTNIGQSGDTGNIDVTCNTGCAWTVTSNAAWITSSSSGTGSGTASYSVAANSGPARSSTVTIAGKTFTVNQLSGCSYTISPASRSIGAEGGTGTVSVTSVSGCGWTASSNESWITVTGGSSGTGNGTVSYSVDPNYGPPRSGTVTIAGQTFTVSQSSGCAYSISPTSTSIDAGGGTGTVNVAAGSSCGWTVSSNESWITVTGGSSGTGDGTVSYSISVNTGPARNGTVTIAGQTFTVSQLSGCSYTISPTSRSIGSTGDIGSISVTSGAGCGWSASSNTSWITVTGGSSGSGNGTVSYSVAANTGPWRSGTLTIAGQTFTVNQSNGCSYSISPTSSSVGSGSITGTVSVSSSNGSCSWNSSSNASWITITGGSSGSGNGTVSYSVAANTGPWRSGTLTIAGQTFTVNQSNGCTYSISPTSSSIGSSGGTGTVSVSSSNGSCGWNASSNASWITVTGGSSGTGNGTVSYSVAVNTGPARSGTITIAGQTFTVNQSNGCTYTPSNIVPTGNTFDPGGGTGSFNLSTASGCTWTVTSNNSWITVTSGSSGTGNGSVTYSVAANTGPTRTGSLNVAGNNFQITQFEGSCEYVISAPPFETIILVPLSGGSGYIGVQCGTSCSWSMSKSSWISASPGSGTGTSTIQYSIPSTSVPRQGYITIEGTTLEVWQIPPF